MDESTRASLPESDDVPPVPESVSSGEGDEGPAFSGLSAEHRDTMRRLYRRVEQAAATIERLRAENDRLRRRVAELEDQPAFPDAEAVFALDDDPETVKERIDRFIEAIDAYLEATEPDADTTEDGSDD